MFPGLLTYFTVKANNSRDKKFDVNLKCVWTITFDRLLTSHVAGWAEAAQLNIAKTLNPASQRSV